MRVSIKLVLYAAAVSVGAIALAAHPRAHQTRPVVAAHTASASPSPAGGEEADSSQTDIGPGLAESLLVSSPAPRTR